MTNNIENTGILLKAVGGLYFVKTPVGVLTCKARGALKLQGLLLCAGDRVVLDMTNEGIITEILPRKNNIIRPPLSNLDLLIFVISTCEPSPNFTVLDKFVAISEYKGIEPVIAITKTDLEENPEISQIYGQVNIRVLTVGYEDGKSREEFNALLAGKTSAFTGNSGVGKSTLLNYLNQDLGLETNEISKKLGRGKHTTRQVELYELEGGGYIADTPGFSAIETNRYDLILKEELSSCFREFAPFLGKCRFQDCSHIKESGCAVRDAVDGGIIPKTRYNSYSAMHSEAAQIKEWEQKK